jgi:hypothetical protein
MKRIKISIIFIIGLGLIRLHAQDSGSKYANVYSTDSSIIDSMQQNIQKEKFRQGFVTSSASPFFGIYGLAYFHELKSIKNSRGDILLGVAHQNQKNDDGQFNGISLVLGYRQFLFRKLCVTGNFYPNYNHFESSIDEETYVGFDGFCEISLGWEFEIKLTQKIILALTPQYTFGQALFRTNPWPRHEEKLQSFHFPDIYIGIVF